MPTALAPERSSILQTKNIQVVDIPRHVQRDTYERAIQRMSDRLRRYEGILAVYQIGNVSTPGISDIDMLVVLKDDYRLEDNLLEELDEEERYLFVHGLYGVPEALFDKVKQFFYLNNFRLLSGREFLKPSDLSEYSAMPAEVRAQIALEYLLKMYITIFVQKTYRVFKLRGFFLHVKALAYDLELLGVHGGPLFNAVHAVIEMRNTWFTSSASEDSIIAALMSLERALHSFLCETMNNQVFYLPGPEAHHISRSIIVQGGGELRGSQTGVVLPSFLNKIGRRYYSIQNRLLKFEFEVPANTERLPVLIERRFLIAGKARQYNRDHLPHFLPLISSLNVS